MKGRLNSNIYLSNGEKIPYYFIEDTILHDVKNIMSSTVVKTNDNHYVCHIELQPETKVLKEEIIDSLMMRLYDRFPSELLKNLYINIRTSFPVAPSGKRDISSLVLENNVDDFISCKITYLLYMTLYNYVVCYASLKQEKYDYYIKF